MNTKVYQDYVNFVIILMLYILWESSLYIPAKEEQTYKKMLL